MARKIAITIPHGHVLILPFDEDKLVEITGFIHKSTYLVGSGETYAPAQTAAKIDIIEAGKVIDAATYDAAVTTNVAAYRARATEEQPERAVPQRGADQAIALPLSAAE